MSAGSWRDNLTPDDLDQATRAGFGLRIGLGERAAVVVIDAQQYMIGPPPGSTHWYPSACGPAALIAIKALQEFLTGARELGLPIFYSQFLLRRDGADAGVYGLKRGLPDTEGWCLEGSEGAAIVDEVAPTLSDIVFVKKKFGAFSGTPLLGYLLDRRIDSLIIAGGSTSNCVRATAVEAASVNLRTTVLEDCVFDRFARSHVSTLIDLERQYADVRSSADVLADLTSRLDAR